MTTNDSARNAINWRASSWLVPVGSLNADQQASHEAALTVLDEYNAKGTPFALFLRTFAIRQLYCHASDGGDGGDGILLDVHFTRQLRRMGVHVLRVLDSSGVEIAIPTETPALALENATWLAAVKQLIDSAELVISECQFLSPGVVEELRACAATKLDETVLVTPSAPFEFVGNDEVVQLFPRMIQQFNLDLACPARTYVFQDLIERLGEIAKMDVAARLQLMREGRLREVIPVSYRGVVEGHLGLAERYAREKNPNATVFAGARAIVAARRARGLGASMEMQLTVSELCENAGHSKLALVLVDEVDRDIREAGAELSLEPRDQLISAARERRSKVLGSLFESLMTPEKSEELWRLANSQGGYAVQRGDVAALAQCLSWMAVAACLSKQYELAIEPAQDAINLARSSGDTFREAFASFYLGNALRGLNRLDQAAEAFAAAISSFPKDRAGRIYAAAFLSLAQVSEKLGMQEPATQLYLSARDMAIGTGQADIEAAAKQGLERSDDRPRENLE